MHKPFLSLLNRVLKATSYEKMTVYWSVARPSYIWADILHRYFQLNNDLLDYSLSVT